MRRSALCFLVVLVGFVGCGNDGSRVAPDHSSSPDSDDVVDGHASDAASPEVLETVPRPLIVIAIDSLSPDYLDLDENGGRGGKGWLMPNLHDFLKDGKRFNGTKCFLPSATDPNHINALASTNSAESGIVGVSVQFQNWDAAGNPLWARPSLSWARTGENRPVMTLFQAWKARWKDSRTAFVSGKPWVAEAFRVEGSGIDRFVHSDDHPDWIGEPSPASFYDPPTDEDAQCDPESVVQKNFVDQVMAKKPEHFPSDQWVVDAALRVLEEEAPDFLFVLLAQADDAQHAMGAASNPDEFVPREPRYVPPAGCPDRPEWQLVSKRNRHVYREPILDAIRDVDHHFGRLVRGIRAIPKYRDALIAVYSDHGHVTHLVSRDWKPGDGVGPSTDVVGVLFDRGVITKEEKDFQGFAVLSGTSLGMVHFRGESLEARRARAKAAKAALLEHEVENPETGVTECPWHVLDQDDMQKGVAGVAAAGELWHPVFGPSNSKDGFLWPDLFVFAKNGWQLPVYEGNLGNLGVDLPEKMPPMVIFLGGHGAPDTASILMAMAGPGVTSDPPIVEGMDYRVADLAATIAAMWGLTFDRVPVGKDRSAELK